MARFNLQEVGLPPADCQLSSTLFVFAKRKRIAQCFCCWKPDLAKLNANVARPDLQQRETDSTPFVISKTNNPDVKRESASGGRVSTDVIWQQITQ